LAGRDTKISDLPTDVAANARGVAAIAKHYINHLFGNDKNTKGNSTPHEVPDAATVDGYLQKYGETYIGVMNAAKILDGTKREKGSAATESAKAIIHLGKRVLPAVIADHTPQSEHDLHLTTNAIIAANFGRDQRRNGPTAAPLLWTRAACLAGKTLLVSPNTPGGKERAVAALEALERSLHRTLRGHGYGSVAMPQEVTDIQQAYSSAKQLAAEKGETYDQAMTRMASVAADYARTIVSREAAAEQAKRQPLPVAEVQQAGPTPAQKKAERVVKYAATVLRPTEQLAWGAQDALSSLNEIAGNLKLGDIKAMPYGRLERYEQHAADALRSTVALMEQAEHGDPDTAQKAATALGQLETGGALIRYAYLHKDDVARGEVSPEMAKLITRYEPQSVAEKAAIGQLKEALTDAAYRNLPYGKAYAPSVMNTADGKTIPHQLRLADATEKSIAEFVREAYVDSLSSVTAEPGRLTPQQMEFLAKSADDRVVRMYRHAKNIKNTRAIPEQLQDMYNTVMSQGRELTGAKRLGRAASFMDEMLAHNGAGRPRA
jgi:hypothetical protein